MSIEIRILQHGDESILTRVVSEVFDDPLVTHATQEFLSDARHHLAVALENDVVIGFASGVHYIHPDKPRPEFWINEVGVAPTHQSRGVGKSLMHALLGVARNIGCTEAWVLTERENMAARRLYKSVGGDETPDGIVMFTFQLISDVP